MTNENVWAELAAPLDPDTIRQRDDKGTPIRYIDARTVIDRLNSVCPGEWHFETELLSAPTGEKGSKWVFKGRLTVCGCVHEDVGVNDNENYFDPPKAAVSDALKRCAVHFGIGIELYPSGGRQQPGKPTNVKPVNAPRTAHAPAGQPAIAGDADIVKPRYSAPQLRDAIQGSIAKRVAKNTDDALAVSDDLARKLAITWRNVMPKKPVDLTGEKPRYAMTSYLLSADVTTFKGLAVAAHDALHAWLTDAPAFARAEANAVWAEIKAIEDDIEPGPSLPAGESARDNYGD
jgi:hypothetical protein